MVSQPLINELREIIRQEYGRDLDPQEASRIGNGLVGYFNLLAKMYHENNQHNENEYEDDIHPRRNHGKSQ